MECKSSNSFICLIKLLIDVFKTLFIKSKDDLSTPTTTGSLNTAFNNMYILLVIVTLFCIFIMWFTIIIDLAYYILISYITEPMSLSYNPNMLYKNCLNFSCMHYATNNTGNTKFLIYMRQFFLIGMFSIASIIIFVAFVHVLIHMLLTIISVIHKNINYTESFNRPTVATMFVLITFIIFCLLHNLTYYYGFTKKYQPVIQRSYNDLNNLSNAIYDNITKDATFLESVTQDNLLQAVNAINSNNGNQSETIGKMIFTICLYNHFKQSSNEPDFPTVKSIFTTKQIVSRDIKPAEYLTCAQPRYIDNLYSIIEPYITVLNTEQLKQNVRDNVSMRINTINNLIMNTMIKHTASESVATFIGLESIQYLLFVALTISVVYYTNQNLNKSKITE